jgi:hypothetical protein
MLYLLRIMKRFLIGLLILVVVASQQVVLNDETVIEQVCKDTSDCLKCSFSDMRLIDSCTRTGYKKTQTCEIRTSLNNTQTLTSSTTCKSSQVPILSTFHQGLAISLLSLTISSFLFFKKRLSRQVEQEINLSNIIKA